VIVLGLNTRLELPGRRDGHDPAACLFVDGELVCAVEEERFSRVRYAAGAFPRQAAGWCLATHDLTLDDVDVVAVGWDPRLQVDAPEPTRPADWLEQTLPAQLFPRSAPPRVEFVQHHLAHAVGAFHSSPFHEAAVLVVDGAGERESISWYAAGPDGISLRGTLPIANSLGFFYQATSEFVGLGSMGEGKTMGLAAYGQPTVELASPLRDPPHPPDPAPTLRHNEDVVAAWRAQLAARSGLPPNPARIALNADTAAARWRPEAFPQPYRDVAASAQTVLEADLLHLANGVLRELETDNLVLCGGVALNCVANGRLRETRRDVHVYVQPAANDAGVAIGAAAHLSQLGGVTPTIRRDHVYAGPEFGRGRVADLLRAWGLGFSEPDDPIAPAVDRLARGETIAWFHGRSELGPRALGARSLLASPENGRALERMNSIKKREDWRPLAPSVPVELAPRIFADAPEPDSFAHMLLTARLEGPEADRVPAVLHADGSTRPQLLTREDNPLYHELLLAFHRATGVPALINTSFNIGAPIVNNPEQAVQTWAASPIHALFVEGLLLTK
jgi:predicted NodU family carbamoyl transferase